MNAWQFISDKQAVGIQTILLYVLTSTGSSPGRQGFKMAVAADGEFYGTIGGGIMEHKFVEMAKAKLKESPRQPRIHRQVHDKSSGSDHSGMICSGEQTIFFYFVQDSDLGDILKLMKSVENHRNGTLTLTKSGIRFSDEMPAADYDLQELPNGEFVYKEKTGFKNRLIIIGGGHCALALCRVMSPMDFYIQVYEERGDLNTMQQNHFAHQLCHVNSYEELTALVEGGQNVYVVIMTFGYRSDDVALRALSQKDFKYLGMLGSKKKVAKMFADYKLQGLEPSVKQIFSPVGVQIKSKTAEEIAVSIAAQIIEIKNRDQ